MSRHHGRDGGDRVINRGAFVLMIGFARPLRFVGRVVRLWWQRPD